MLILTIVIDEKFICVVFSLWQEEVLISPSRRFFKGNESIPAVRNKKITPLRMLIQTLAGKNHFSLEVLEFCNPYS